MVLSTTSGWPSKPRAVPVENVHATLRFLTLSAVICASGLYRHACALRPGSGHDAGGGAPGASAPEPAGGALPVAAIAIGACSPRHAATEPTIVTIAIHEPAHRLPFLRIRSSACARTLRAFQFAGVAEAMPVRRNQCGRSLHIVFRRSVRAVSSLTERGRARLGSHTKR